MRHLKKESIEIWVLEDGEAPPYIVKSNVSNGLASMPEMARVRLSELTEEQYATLAARIMHSPRTIDNVKINTDLVLDEIDQLLKENGLHGLRVGERPFDPEPIDDDEHLTAHIAQDRQWALVKAHDSKVPPEKIIVKI